VGVVWNDPVSDAKAFAAHYGSLYPSIIDQGGVIANSYGVTSPPTTFVINAKGVVEATLLGPVSTRQLEEVVAQVRA
jgi:alkyl hydroperoxide reductase subunit AhpC